MSQLEDMTIASKKMNDLKKEGYFLPVLEYLKDKQSSKGGSNLYFKKKISDEMQSPSLS